MIRATYRTLPNLIATKTPFVHGSCHAFIDDENTYRVFSYSTQIALFQLTGEPSPSLNETKYSMTTSRLQNIIRKAWAI
jgi:hypothetical protein